MLIWPLSSQFQFTVTDGVVYQPSMLIRSAETPGWDPGGVVSGGACRLGS